MTLPERLRSASASTAAADPNETSQLGEFGCLVGGEWRQTGDVMAVRSPFDGALVGRVHRARPAEIEQAIVAAVAAFQVTRKLPVWRRAEALERIGAGIAARREEFARTIALEAGKPIPVFGDGTMGRDYTFVDDTVAGVLAVTTVVVTAGVRCG